MRKFLSSTVAAWIFVMLSIRCEGDSQLPTAPPPPQPPPNAARGFIWGHVVNDQGQCLIDAVVEIIHGPNTGQRFVQKEACSIWEEGGFEFRELPLGVPITLRATKEGYHPQEREAFAFTSGHGIDIFLRKE